MSRILKTTIISSLALCLFSCNHDMTEACANSREVVVEEGNTVKMVVPDRPYANGSIQILPKDKVADVTGWNPLYHAETRKLINKIASVWEKSDVAGYLIYGKNNPDLTFHWDVVPFPSAGSRWVKQFKVIWKTIFGASCSSYGKKVEEANYLITELNALGSDDNDTIPADNDDSKGDDAFCHFEVIEKQLIFSGEKVYVIYNYAPIGIGEDKLHFLVLPKKHRLNFSDLTEDEYNEAMLLSQRLVEYYRSKGFETAYIFNKTGAEAGQSVPHWHQHVIFIANDPKDYFGKLNILKTMVFRSAPLPQEELKLRVESIRAELAPIFYTPNTRVISPDGDRLLLNEPFDDENKDSCQQ